MPKSPVLIDFGRTKTVLGCSTFHEAVPRSCVSTGFHAKSSPAQENIGDRDRTFPVAHATRPARIRRLLRPLQPRFKRKSRVLRVIWRLLYSRRLKFRRKAGVHSPCASLRLCETSSNLFRFFSRMYVFSIKLRPFIAYFFIMGPQKVRTFVSWLARL